MSKRAKGPNTGPGHQAQLRFNESACADKVSESGLNYFYGDSNAEGLLGALNSGIVVPKFRSVLVCNTDTSVHFVALGDTGLSAPTGGANGIPVAPQSCIVLATGDNISIRSDNAAIFGYLAEDNIFESTN